VNYENTCSFYETQCILYLRDTGGWRGHNYCIVGLGQVGLLRRVGLMSTNVECPLVLTAKVHIRQISLGAILSRCRQLNCTVWQSVWSLRVFFY